MNVPSVEREKTTPVGNRYHKYFVLKSYGQLQQSKTFIGSMDEVAKSRATRIGSRRRVTRGLLRLKNKN